MVLQQSFLKHGEKILASYSDAGKEIATRPILEFDQYIAPSPIVANNPVQFKVVDNVIPLVLHVDYGTSPSGTVAIQVVNPVTNAVEWGISLNTQNKGEIVGNLWVYQFPLFCVEKDHIGKITCSANIQGLVVYGERMGILRKYLPE